MQQSYQTSPSDKAYQLKRNISVSVSDTRLIISYLTRAAAILDHDTASLRDKNLARLMRLMARKLAKRMP